MSYGNLQHDNRSSYAVARGSGSRSPTLRKVTTYESESGDSDFESLDGLEAQQGYELTEFKASRRHDQAKVGASIGASDNGNNNIVNDAFPGDLGTYPKSKSFTFDEEETVRRKFDRRLVLFVAFLYMLSFLDRSSKSSIFT